ncbi:MAG: LamG domain-containing protein [Planctomycetes bacterium]|nr:LamG domain-containing protein [Planctomycetota bacterium]
MGRISIHFGFLACAAASCIGTRAIADVESYRAAVQATEGLLDYYALEEDFSDSIDGGNGSNHGWTAADGPPFVAGVNGEGEAIQLDGSMQFLRIARSIQGDFTIIAWLKTDRAGLGSATSTFYQGSGFIYADIGGTANDFGTAVTGNVFAFGLGNPDQTIHSTREVTTGEWIQVVALRDVDEDAGNAEYRIYIDGEPDGDGIHANIQPLEASTTITIGGNTIDGRYFGGAIDEVALFTEALDEGTIVDLRDAAEDGMAAYRQAVRATEGLIDYYDYEGRYGDDFEGDDGLNDPENVVSTSAPAFDLGIGDEGLAAVFDGIDDSFSILRSIQDDFTILAWVRTDHAQVGTDTSTFYQGSGLIYADVPNVMNDFGTAITGTRFAFGAGNPDTTIHSTTPVTEDEWMHVAAVREVGGAGSAVLRLYVNGWLEAELEHANAAPLAAAAVINIGGNVADVRYFGGAIDEIALFEVALDEDTIAGIFDAYEGGGNGEVLFRRGDVDANGILTIGDAVTLLNYQFADGPAPPDPGLLECGPDPTGSDPWTPENCKYPQDLCR